MSDNNSVYNFLGKITASALGAVSVFVIAISFFGRKKKVSYKRLRQAYDGLSPRDYDEN
ncbi:MAG: hypothetical protein II816_00065 [Elusimicrobia bacterium]|nr:hypothetical protein [Elusimicrobiota bacterium]